MLQENQQEKEKIMWIDDEALARKDRNQKRKFEMLKKIAITLAGIALVAGLAAGGAVGIFVGKRTEAKAVDAKVAAFVLPNDLITGGTTGIALILEHYFGLPIGLSVAIFNIVMFILAILILGKSFALTALISTFYFPWILSQFQKVQFIQNMTDDFLLGSIFAGLMLGLGVGLVIRAGASTGGMDIPPLILNKKFGLPVSIGLYVFDFTILIIQMSFRDKERILYGILLVLIYSTLVDKVLLMGKTQMQVKIISDHYEEINKVIQEKLDRGSTFFKTESGYLRKDSFAIMTVVSSRELPKLNELVLEIDKQAFIVINQVNEVMGRGFTLHKQAE